MNQNRAQSELEAALYSISADIYQRAATTGIHSLESLCRKAHIIQLRLRSMKSGSEKE